MIEQWERWEPIAKLSAKYYVESICYHLENLTIVLFDEVDTKVQVTIGTLSRPAYSNNSHFIDVI